MPREGGHHAGEAEAITAAEAGRLAAPRAAPGPTRGLSAGNPAWKRADSSVFIPETARHPRDIEAQGRAIRERRLLEEESPRLRGPSRCPDTLLRTG